MKLLIGPDIWKQTASDFYTYVKSLRQLRPASTNASKSVPDVSISFKKKTIVRIGRANKTVTEAEVLALSTDYGKPADEMTALLTARKIRIVNDSGEQTNVTRKPAAKRAGRRPKKAAEANAGSNT